MEDYIIEITLNNKEDYINKYNEKKLSKELSDYILEEVKGIDIKQKITLLIESKFEMSEEEQKEFVDMVRKNFGTDVSEIMNISKKEYIMNVIITFIGILFIIIYVLTQSSTFISEIMLIIGWVFIGESICNFLYHGVENRLKIKRRKQIINGKVEFK